MKSRDAQRKRSMADDFWCQYFTGLSQKRICGELIRRAIHDAKQQGRKGLVLTCKEKLVSYYAKFGFLDEGVSEKSTHGNAEWHQMRLAFDNRKLTK